MSIWLIIFFGYPNKRPRHGQTSQNTTPSLKLRPEEKELYIPKQRHSRAIVKIPCDGSRDGITCSATFARNEELTRHKKRYPHEKIEVARQKDPPSFQNADGTFSCGITGCDKSYEVMPNVLKHYENAFHENARLFVYLPHHLVFKTDIIIPVNAHISDAKTNLFVR